METYATWVRLFELLPFYSWIVDRFHISTQAYQLAAHKQYYDFGWLEDRLLPLGFRLIFCTRSPESFAAARARRLEVSGNPEQYDDLSLFVAEQQQIQELISASRLPVLQLDVSHNDVGRAADEIAAWLETTDGLFADNWPTIS